MTITDEMVERALNATTEELPEGVQYALIRGLNAMGWEIAITGSHDVMHAALSAALEGREEPDATAAYMAGFERGKEAATAEERERCARVADDMAAEMRELIGYLREGNSLDRAHQKAKACEAVAAAIRGGG